jgi:hypothetical protein
MVYTGSEEVDKVLEVSITTPIVVVCCCFFMKRFVFLDWQATQGGCQQNLQIVGDRNRWHFQNNVVVEKEKM